MWRERGVELLGHAVGERDELDHEKVEAGCAEEGGAGLGGAGGVGGVEGHCGGDGDGDGGDGGGACVCVCVCMCVCWSVGLV